MEEQPCTHYRACAHVDRVINLQEEVACLQKEKKTVVEERDELTRELIRANAWRARFARPPATPRDSTGWVKDLALSIGGSLVLYFIAAGMMDPSAQLQVFEENGEGGHAGSSYEPLTAPEIEQHVRDILEDAALPHHDATLRVCPAYTDFPPSVLMHRSALPLHFR